MDWKKTTASRDEKHLCLGIWCALYYSIYGIFNSIKSTYGVAFEPASAYVGTQQDLITLITGNGSLQSWRKLEALFIEWITFTEIVL